MTDMVWKPIETAPKDGEPILAADNGTYAYVVEWREWPRVWRGADGHVWEPTHWMPLPAPPDAALNEGGQP